MYSRPCLESKGHVSGSRGFWTNTGRIQLYLSVACTLRLGGKNSMVLKIFIDLLEPTSNSDEREKKPLPPFQILAV